MNITELWLQLQELEQQVNDAKSQAKQSNTVLLAELNLINSKVQASYSAQKQRLEALSCFIKTLRGIVGTMVSQKRLREQRLLMSEVNETPIQAVTPSEDTLGGGQ
ncbi:MAG: hypothetical protein ACM37W_09075 [Actinomycetota bacterium]